MSKSVLKVVIGLCCLLNSCANFAALFGNPSDAPDLGNIPFRSYGAMSGSEFINSTNGMSAGNRERAILRQLKAGNVPSFIRVLRPVHLSMRDRNGRTIRGTIWVTPDYLAIGSDTDFVRIPMNPITAQRIADYYGYKLPTRKIVNDIYKAAKIKLAPRPMKASRSMTSNSYYHSHSNRIERQLGGRDHTLLVAGHKKDVVISNRLARLPHRVAIYGWHRTNGRPIQPLSLVHGNKYADYSHGIRLVSNTMVINGIERSLDSVLKDYRFAKIVSDEGVMKSTRVFINDLRALNTPTNQEVKSASAH